MYIYLAAPGDKLRLLNRPGWESIQVNFHKTDKISGSKTVLPHQTWFCYEWNSPTSVTVIFQDGIQLTDRVAPCVAGATSLGLGHRRFVRALFDAICGPAT